MIITSPKVKISLKFQQSLLLIILIFVSAPSSLFGQDPSTDLTDALERFNQNIGGSGKGNQESAPSSADGYKSFVQNELQNIFYKKVMVCHHSLLLD